MGSRVAHANGPPQQMPLQNPHMMFFLRQWGLCLESGLTSGGQPKVAPRRCAENKQCPVIQSPHMCPGGRSCLFRRTLCWSERWYAVPVSRRRLWPSQTFAFARGRRQGSMLCPSRSIAQGPCTAPSRRARHLGPFAVVEGTLYISIWQPAPCRFTFCAFFFFLRFYSPLPTTTI